MSEGQKLLLYISYDGSHFCGYQAQQNGPSVQRELNRATEELFGYPCDITGCSRTDSGVHARMFCATVTRHGTDHLDTTIPTDRVCRALNIHLPDSVAAWGATWVPSDFHARYSVSSKEYEYRFLCKPERDPFEHGRSWHIPRPLSDGELARMQDAAYAFIGKRDFAACMASGSTVASTVRHVMDATVDRKGDIVTFRVRADGFLYNMVRIMAGTLIDVARGTIPAHEIAARLDSLDRRMMGRTAPAEGLYLNRVFYDDPDREGYHGGGDTHGR